MVSPPGMPIDEHRYQHGCDQAGNRSIVGTDMEESEPAEQHDHGDRTDQR